MSALAPFEPAPHLAVAVSGGPDSMALILLAADWVKGISGSITGLTVDHQLRHGSRDEALQTGNWLRERGIDHVILTRSGPKPAGDLQAAARKARYKLLKDWCHEHGVLHLLTAHHQDDQAETLLLRLGRGSGLNGLASMSSLNEDGACRVLRPLLGFARDKLLATLDVHRQASMQDPSNDNPSFSRIRVRQAIPGFASLGLTPDRLATTARQLGRSRMAIENGLERSLARLVMIHPAGFARVDPTFFRKEPADRRARALASILCAIGGEPYPPRFERLERVLGALSAESEFTSSTLGGCQIIRDQESLLIFPELRAVAHEIALTARRFKWDRFDGILSDPMLLDDLRIGPLGLKGMVTFKAKSLDAAIGSQVPKKIWGTLPALRQKDRIIAVPHLRWSDANLGSVLEIQFRPERPLTASGFFVS